MDGVIYLVQQTPERTASGVWQRPSTARRIFCQVDSITRQEFFSAGRNGLNPEFTFTIFAGDYQGESVLLYQDKPYAIYRTYYVPDTDYLELYVQREGGTNGQNAN